MKNKLLLCLIAMGLAASPVVASQCPAVLDHAVTSLNEDKQVSLCDAYRGKVILIVNTASKCAYTPQYEALESLYQRYRDRGLVVLGFPSNDFGNQEPGSEQKIKRFCRLTYGVKFPMFSKTRVRENNADPLYRSLGTLAGEFPSWNFHKYLLDRSGKLIGSFPGHVPPHSERILGLIKEQL